MKPTFLFVLLATTIWGCQTSNENIYKRNTMATLYMQQSPEYIALAEQAYHQARLSLDEQLAHASMPLAVVTDIDETVLDNSPYQAKQVLEGFNYPDHWDEWVNKEEAKPIPGSLAFLQHADSLGISIFYISNRKASLLIPTINNLNKFGYPQTDSTHLYLKTTTSSKEERRNKVNALGYEIAVFIGDNLDDMSASFETNNPEERFKAQQEATNKFGTKYIVLPNPSYGKWAQNRGFYTSKLNQDSLASVYLKGF